MNKFLRYFLGLLGLVALVSLACQQPTQIMTPVPTATLTMTITTMDSTPTTIPVGTQTAIPTSSIVCVVTANALNIRELPNNHSEILDVLYLGDTIIVTEKIGNWLKLEKEGYVHANYVECP